MLIEFCCEASSKAATWNTERRIGGSVKIDLREIVYEIGRWMEMV
jgi:hypothetical protein